MRTTRSATTRRFLHTFLITLVLNPTAPAATKLNVLLITADDLGPYLSCYGETRFRTPHLDHLAASSVQFRVAYVTQASCSPSRSSIFTGMYVHSTGQWGLTNTGLTLHRYLREFTIPNLLKRAGYRTGIIGKLHVAPEESFQFDFRPQLDTRRVRDVAAAVDQFLRETAGQPFFLMVNYSDPHAFRRPEDPAQWFFPAQVDGLPDTPLLPSSQTLLAFQQIDTPEQRERTAGYFNAILRLDAGIGMLMRVLENHRHNDDTLIIFVGDHGPPFARGKTTVYEAGVRIPFLVRWPGVSGRFQSDALVSTVDILPTILDAVGLKIPAHVQGRSLRPVLQSRDAPWREYLCAEFHFHGSRPFFPRRAIRDHRYKLIHNLLAGRVNPSTGIDGDRAYQVSQSPQYAGTEIQRAFATFANPPEFELYDLEADPIEFHNLAGRPEYRTVEERLKRALWRWRRETRDPFLDPGFLERVLELTRTGRLAELAEP